MRRKRARQHAPSRCFADGHWFSAPHAAADVQHVHNPVCVRRGWCWRCMQILPMENEAGRLLVERGKLCERKNGRGVDPNRNWPIDWGVKERDYDPNVRCGAASWCMHG